MGKDMLNTMKYISTVQFSGLINWSVQYLNDSKIAFNKSYPMMPIGEFLKRNKTTVIIQDGVKYKRVTIKIRNGGVVTRDEVKGENIGTKKQFRVESGQFIISKIDARNGAMGIIPNELDGAVVTPDFLSFDIDTTKVNPKYLVLVCTTGQFVEFCHSCSSGTTNRQRINETQFLNIKIPVPSLEKQNELIEKYCKQILSSNKLLEKAKLEEKNIQQYILAKLGVKLPVDIISQKKKKSNLISRVSYKDVERWDMWSKEYYIDTLLNKSTYPISRLGSLAFTTRKWEKDTDNFRYIEISDIDPVWGIINDTNLSTGDAPSRATQRVCTGDLIIGTTRPYLKRFAIVSEKHNQCICSSAFQVISPDKEYDIEFVYYFLQTQLAVIQFESYMTGALYPYINTSDLCKIKILLPPLSVQNSIVRYANKKRVNVKSYILESRKRCTDALRSFEAKIFEQK